MLHTDSRFHAVPSDSENGTILFMRLCNSDMQVLDADKAYHASISNPTASIVGCVKPPTKQIISLLLSIPNTSAQITLNELQLRCKDKSAVQLLIKLPITRTPAKPLLQALHSALMLAAASLEGALLEIVGADMRTEIDLPTPESLDILHGPLIAGGQPVETRSAFRRVAAADTRLHAARAFAVAQVAGQVREEILGKRKEREDQERLKRRRERERIREAKRLLSAGHGVKRPKRSLFDVESESPSAEVRSKANSQSAVDNPDSHTEKALKTAKMNPKFREESQLNRKTGAAIGVGVQKASSSDAGKSSDLQESGAVQRETGDPMQRKKKRKARKLV